MEICRYSEKVHFSPDKPAKTVLSEGKHCRTTLWCLEVGQVIHPHEHEGDHLWVVQEGTGWFLTGDNETPVEAGNIIFAPQGEPHGMRAGTRLVFVSVSAGPS
jgi:quercetin dioxygenase-like cupin family protein